MFPHHYLSKKNGGQQDALQRKDEERKDETTQDMTSEGKMEKKNLALFDIHQWTVEVFF